MTTNERMSTENRTRPAYDVPTAITFLLGGIGLGAILTLLFSPLRAETGALRTSKLERTDAPVPAVLIP